MRLRSTAPAIVLGVLALAAGASSALSQTTQSEQSDRLHAYLTATQAELAGTGHDVDSIEAATEVSGLQVFVLRGPAAQCLLIASASQPDGHSQQLACTRDAAASEGHPLATSIAPLANPDAPIDFVALPQGATDVSVTSDTSQGKPATVIVRRDVAVVTRDSQLAPATLSWATGGQQHQLRLEPKPLPLAAGHP